MTGRARIGWRRLALSLAVLGALGAAQNGCSRSGGTAASASGDVVLKIAGQKGATRALMEVSHALDGAPYKVEWSEFPSAQTLLEALNADAADAGIVGDAPFMFAYASGAQIKVVSAYHAGGGGGSTAIVVPGASPIHAIADLRGRKIATGKGSIGHYLLLRVLEKAGLKPTDVTILYLSPGDAKAALAAGSIDAWATWNPYVALGVLHGGDRVLINGQGLLHPVGFEAATQTAIAAKRPQLDDFLRRLATAERWESAHTADYAAVLAKDTGLPLDVAQVTVNSQRPTPVSMDAALIADEQDTLAHFKGAGVIDAAPDVAGAFDTGFNDAVR
jgi:sulfonate transport system substrate-binding protein